MDLFKKPLLISVLLFAGVASSLLLSSPLPFILSCLITILINPISCLPIVFLIPVIDSILNLNAVIEFPIESIIIGLLLPIILWNILLTSPKLIPSAKKFFRLFLLLIVFGTVMALIQTYYRIDVAKIIQSNAVNFLRIVFCLSLSYFLVGMKIERLLNGFKICAQMAPWIMIVVVYYYITHGEVKGFKYSYINLGEIRHGSFSGALVAYSSLLFYNIYESSKKYFKLLNAIALAFLGYLIFIMGSKNGLGTLIFMIGMTSIFFFIKGKTNRFIGLFGSAIVVLSLTISSLADLPTISRLLRANTSSGIDLNTLTTGRLGLWAAGIDGIFSWQGFLGYGGTPLASRYVTGISQFVKEDNVLHNTPMEFVLHYGIFGFILYFSLIFAIYKCFKYFYRKSKNEELPAILLVPFLCFFSLTLSSMALSWQWYSYWWYQVAIIFAMATLFGYSNQKKTIFT